MEINKDVKILNNFLLYNGLIKYKLNDTASRVFTNIYDKFEKSRGNINLISRDVFLDKKNKILHNKFLPEDVKYFINNNKANEITYKFKVGFRLIELKIFLYGSKDINYVNNLYNLISLIIFFFSGLGNENCNTFLKINLYLTNLKKMIKNNGNVLGPENVNSGYSYVCRKDGEITIYRKEECVKVLIHECIHSFGLEFSDLNLKEFNNKIKELFPLSIEYNIFESYTEIWAELINICLISYKLSDSNVKKYLKNVESMISYEMTFSKFQMDKVLFYNNIDLKDLLVRNVNYKENSSIFAYYILKCLIILNLDLFLDWCNNNNKNLVKFREDKSNLFSFYNLIKKIIEKDKDLERKDKFRLDVESRKNFKFILYNLRMSCLEI